MVQIIDSEPDPDGREWIVYPKCDHDIIIRSW